MIGTVCFLLAMNLLFPPDFVYFESSAYLQNMTPKKSSQKWHLQKKTWQRAMFKELVMGKSSHRDMVKVLGNPSNKEVFKSEKLIWYHYPSIGEFPGKITIEVMMQNNLIKRVFLNPDNLSKEEAIAHFGNKYVLTRYDFDECEGDGESAPLYESPKGSIEVIEYRERGIALVLGSYGNVNYIQYVRDPIGSKWAKCKKKK